MRRRIGGAIGCLLAFACEPPQLVPDDGRCGPPDAQPLPAGGWLVEGDILAADLEGMSDEAVSGGPGFRSAVKCGPALDRVWDVGRKLALTYCLGEFADVTLRAHTEQALRPATGQWERATGINFIHRAELDGTSECRAPAAVAFVVHQGDADCGARGCPLASASFPPATGDAASLVVYPEALQSELYTIETVLLHELGHLLGFVHEHSRFEQEAEICVDAASTEFRGLTYPDPASVMGDARCPGISPAATRGRLSAGDRLGAWILYGLPRARRVDFDGDGRHDFLWFTPGGSTYEVWFGAPGPGFAVERHELCDGTGACTAPPAWRPIALRGADGRTEVLMFGPREVADERWRPRRRGRFERSPVVADSTAVPVVGAFGAGPAEAVWWLEPGEASELWWEWTADRTIRHRRAAGTLAGYGWPLVGRWRPDAGQLLWLDAQRTTAGLRAIGPAAQMPDRTGLPACGLRAGREQVPLVGDFDGDGFDEVLWWDPRAEAAVRWEVDALWDEEGRCRASGWSRIAGAGGLAARPVIGDFDGDGADEVLWTQAGRGTTTWRPGAEVPEVGIAPPLAADATGCVGDVDGDGCDDVLWFAPGQGASPLWRAACSGDMRFETGSVVTPPDGAYPVGCG
jgi:hypothetical protein